METVPRVRCKKSSPGRIDAFGKLEIDYSLGRPFEKWPETELSNCFESALSQPKSNLKICTLIIIEIKERNGNTKEVEKKLEVAGGKIIPWLKGARHQIQHHVSSFKASLQLSRNCKVYLILLTEDLKTSSPWGIYVGQTSKKIEKP